MQITQRDASNTLRTPTVWTQRDASGTLRTLNQIWMRDATNTLRQVYSSASSSKRLTPDLVQGFGNSISAIFVTTDTATVSPASATATFTWNFADAGWSAVNPSSPSTRFRKSVAAGETATTTVTCTIETAAHLVTTNAITASVTNYGGGAG